MPTYQAIKRPWFTGAVENNDFNITSPYLFAQEGNQVIEVSAGFPVYENGLLKDDRNQIIGVVGIELDLSDISKDLHQLEEKSNISI